MSMLSTFFMGLSLQSPLIASSGPQNLKLENLVKMEEAGVGAVIMPSLFEEQIEIEDAYQSYQRHIFGYELPKPLQHLTDMEGYNMGSAGYLSLIGHAKEAVNMPIIASLNGVSTEGWVRYARILASAGADAIELNTYFLPTDLSQNSQMVEDDYVHLVQAVRVNTNLPLAVKISPYISALPAFVSRLKDAGADAIVLFNRFYEPDIDVINEAVVSNLDLSNSAELRLRLRWTALLSRQIDINIGVTGGIHTGHDLAKALLAGAEVGMTTSALLQNGIEYAGTILEELTSWMESHDYQEIYDFRGKLSHADHEIDPLFLRSNYIQELRSYADQKEF